MSRIFVFFTALIVAVFAGNIAEDDNLYNGRAGFHVIGGKEYYINSDLEYPWVTAAQSCNLLNMRLISLQDQIKNQNITDYLINDDFNGTYWTSGKRIIDTWYWTGIGRVITYTDWRDTQPNDDDSTDVAIVINSNFDFQWEDQIMEGTYGYTICEHLK